jgi:hypothetical protein
MDLLDSRWRAVMTMRGTSVARKTPMTASSMRVVLWASRGV